MTNWTAGVYSVYIERFEGKDGERKGGLRKWSQNVIEKVSLPSQGQANPVIQSSPRLKRGVTSRQSPEAKPRPDDFS